MIDSEVFAMDAILNEVCVLVTVAFALTLVPCLQRAERSLLSRRDQCTALRQARGGSYRRGRWSGEFLIDSF
jgi:hypothetical protein